MFFWPNSVLFSIIILTLARTMLKYSITKRLMLLYFLVGLSSLSAMGIYSYYKTRSALVNKVYDELQLINIMKTRSIAAWFDEFLMLSDTNNTAKGLSDDTVKRTNWIQYEKSLIPLQRILQNNEAEFLRRSHVHTYLTVQDMIVGQDFIRYQSSVDSYIKNQPESQDTVIFYQGPGIHNDNIDCFGIIQKRTHHPIQWSVITEIDYESAMMPVINLRNDLIFLSVLILILIISIAEVISKMIIQPIKQLTKAAEQIGRGQYEPGISDVPDSELGILAKTFNQMSEQVKTKTSELLEREERLKHFYRATSEGIVFYQSDRVILVNEAFEKMTGYSFDTIKRKNLSEIIFQPPWEVFNQSDGHPELIELKVLKSDGQIFPVEIQHSRIEYKNEKVDVLVIRDITHRKLMEANLQIERQNRLLALYDGQEGERQRIARELHDGLGQQLVALKMKLENLTPVPDSPLTLIIDELKMQLYAAIDEVKMISNDLAPASLRLSGLEAALNNLIRDIKSPEGLDIEFSSHGHFEGLPDKTRIFIYRIAQEALSNALKHSQATHIHLHLTETSDHVVLMVEDNGIGFDRSNENPRKGNGLFNMKERCMVLGGSFDLESAINFGTTIRVKVPKLNKEI